MRIACLPEKLLRSSADTSSVGLVGFSRFKTIKGSLWVVLSRVMCWWAGDCFWRWSIYPMWMLQSIKPL